MHALIPESAVLELSDGSTEQLSREEAIALYLANRSTVPTKNLRIVGGRNEFERARQLKILKWLDSNEKPGRQRVLLIGDSIRMRQSDATGYGLHAYRELIKHFNISHISHNTANSGVVLEYINDWLQCRPEVVHFNAGLHDLSTMPGTEILPWWHHPVPRYQNNLRQIIAAMRDAGVKTIIWASSTPVHDGWHNIDVRTGKPRGALRTNADVIRYNDAAAEVMREFGVPINDLCAVVEREGVEQCLMSDGVHLSAHGARVVGAEVAQAIRSHWHSRQPLDNADPQSTVGGDGPGKYAANMNPNATDSGPAVAIDTAPDAARRQGGPTPALVVGQRLLYLPPSAEAWDVELADGHSTVLSIRPGLYRYDFAAPHRARMLRDHSWLEIPQSDAPPTDLSELMLVLPRVAAQTPIVSTATPDAQYIAGEELVLQFAPADGGFYELIIRPIGGDAATGEDDDDDDDEAGASTRRSIVQGNRLRFKRGIEPGRYNVRVRQLAPVETWRGDAALWSQWSKPLPLTVWRKRDAQQALQARVAEHRLSLMADRDAHGVLTVTDPWALPPNCPDDGDVRWFRTPCFDGSSVLINELPAYYRDPWTYYLDCIAALVERGFMFRTWNELISSAAPKSNHEIVLQFDIDAGPKSFARLYPELHRLGVRGSIMLHRQCHDWYEYDIEELDLDLFQDAERSGWTIGYHNNSIGNVQRVERAGDYSEEVLIEAQRRFADDVEHLRQWFDIRVCTRHGGNVVNHRTPVPESAEVVCVDKSFNTQLWKTIDRSFSDGGFQSRPKPLQQRLAEFNRGRFFIRNHPVKYANYDPDYDVPPLVAEEIINVGGTVNDALRAEVDRAIEKQTRWIDDRIEHRMGLRTTRASHHKPLTAAMTPRQRLGPTIAALYQGRTERFVRQSPWMWGDPRVYWWRMLDVFAPKSGRILNVGAMPPDRRDETLDFVGDATVLEMDIDPARRPDILADITNPPRELLGSFDCVLLFGLTIIHSPSRAVEACRHLVKPGGVVLFGFAADTHPVRGGLWDPVMRPVWTQQREPLGNIGLRGHMWSFTEDSIRELFAEWDDYAFEFFADMFYVVAKA